MQKLMGLLLALMLLAAMGTVRADEAAAPATDGMSSATPFTAEEGKTAGVKSEAQRKAESGAVNVTVSRMRDGGVFQQAEGHLWRTIRNGPVTFYGGWLLVLVPGLILGFYSVFGAIKLHDAPSGRLIKRFSGWERLLHWGTAGAFVLLALSGVVILFGKHVLLPVMGYAAFSWVAAIAKGLHNLVGPLFAVGVTLMFFHFVRDNLFRKIDLQWLRNAHRVLTGKAHVPSGKYNVAEKAWFWGGVALLGVVMSASGLVMDFPNFDQGRHVMQIANLVHGIGAMLFIAAAFGHIYMGTIGTDGALAAMKTGMVDETWAKEHHELWYEEMKAKQSAVDKRG